MARTRTITRPAYPSTWQVAETARVRGAVLTPGRLVRITRDRGTYAFVRHVTNTATGAAWLDVRDTTTGALRAFYVDRVRTVRQKRAAARPAARTARTAAAA